VTERLTHTTLCDGRPRRDALLNSQLESRRALRLKTLARKPTSWSNAP